MVSPNGVVIENWRRVPPSSVKVSISSIGVPPRASSRRKARSASSTSKISVPTPSGGYARLYHDHVLGADTGADLDFLRGCRGHEVARESH